jgi:hypothetical protein
MSQRVTPNVIPHAPNDHRHVQASELLALRLYDNLMCKPFSDIIDYVSAPKFLKPTSKWSEMHLIAFRCLILEDLPVSRIVPISELVDDNDPCMRLVDEHLLASEGDIRSCAAEQTLGPACIFYMQLRAVIRIFPSRTHLQSTLTTVIPTITESQESTPDESYQPSAPVIQPRSEDSEPHLRSSMQSTGSQNSINEDRLVEAANYAVIYLLGILCTFQTMVSKIDTKRLCFRCLDPFGYFNMSSCEPLVPSLVVHGKILPSYNDGCFYLERRRRHRPQEWVIQDSYPRASLEVSPIHPFCCYTELTTYVSVSGKNTLAGNLFKPKSSVKYLP